MEIRISGSIGEIKLQLKEFLSLLEPVGEIGVGLEIESPKPVKTEKRASKSKAKEVVEPVLVLASEPEPEIENVPELLPDPKAPTVTIDMCRAKLKEVFNKKGQAKAMEILKKFGNVRSITEVPPASYSKFKQVCELELS